MPRIVGKQGSIYVLVANSNASFPSASTHVGDIFDWELEIMVEVVECGVKEEIHEQYGVGKITSRVTGERFVQNTAVPANTQKAAASIMLQNLLSGSPGLTGGALWAPVNTVAYSGMTVSYQLWSIDDQTFGTGMPPVAGPYITGEGFLQRVSLRNPRPTTTEQFEIIGTVLPRVFN